MKIEKSVSNPQRQEKGFGFIVQFDEMEYVAFQKDQSFPFPGLINSAYSCSCDENGEMGMKHKISAINIYSDQVFNDTIPKGQPLNSLFQMRTNSGGVTVPLDSIENYPFNYRNLYEIILTSKAVPVRFHQIYNFRIEIIKEDGSTASGTSGEMVWIE